MSKDKTTAPTIRTPNFKRRVLRDTPYNVIDRDEEMKVERRFTVHELCEIDPENPLVPGKVSYRIDVIVPTSPNQAQNYQVQCSEEIKTLKDALTLGVDQAFAAIMKNQTRQALTHGVQGPPSTMKKG